jgi:hypothetical protein
MDHLVRKHFEKNDNKLTRIVCDDRPWNYEDNCPQQTEASPNQTQVRTGGMVSGNIVFSKPMKTLEKSETPFSERKKVKIFARCLGSGLKLQRN